MEINEVTVFKLVLFGIVLVITTVLIVKIGIFSSAGKGYLCQTLLTEPEVSQSIIAETCPEGFSPNFGKFKDVKNGQRCCVQYG